MKRIQIVYGGWLSAPNGVSSLISEMKNHRESFVSKNIDLKIFSLDNYHPRNFEIISSKPRNGNIKEFVKRYSKKSKIFSFLSVYGLFIRHARRVVREYKYKDSDAAIILFHDIFTSYYYLKKYGTSDVQKTAVVLHTNGETFKMLLSYYPVLENSLYQKYLDRIERYVLNRVDKVLFVAQNPMDNFNYLHPTFNRQNAGFIYNGINEKRIRTTVNHETIGKQIRLCTVGTVSQRKGQKIILESIALLNKKEQERFHLTIVGDGPMLMELKNHVLINDLGDVVTFTGSVNNVEEILENSDVFLLISNDEGLPISIMEAMREGLPIISTNVGGIPEMVETDVNGFLINPDANELYIVLKKLLENGTDLSKLGKESRKIFLGKFTTNKMIKNYIDTLLSL